MKLLENTGVEDTVITAALGTEDAVELDFLSALALANQPRQNLCALYQGWIDCVTALNAARISSKFATPDSAASAATLREHLGIHTRL